MMNFNEEGYFQVKNDSENIIAFGVEYVVGGVPIYGYMKNYNPGMTKRLDVPSEATDIQIAIYMYNPPYQLIPIFKGSFSTVLPRCYSISGNLQRYLVSRIPCSDPSDGNDGCNCNCCCCCNCHNTQYNC